MTQDTPGALNPERFAALAAADGGDLERWPSDLRRAGRAYVDAHAEAARLVLEREVDLDGILAAVSPERPSDRLQTAILAARAAAPAPWWRAAWDRLMVGDVMDAGGGAGVMSLRGVGVLAALTLIIGAMSGYLAGAAVVEADAARALLTAGNDAGGGWTGWGGA